MRNLIRRLSQRIPGRSRSVSRLSEQVVEEQREDPVGDTYEMNIPQDHVTVGFTPPKQEDAAEPDDQGAISFSTNCVWCYNPFQVVAGDNGEPVHLLNCCKKKVGAVCLKASETDRCPFCASKIAQ